MVEREKTDSVTKVKTKKKANLEMYPEFGDRIEIIMKRKRNKETGKMEEVPEEKVINKPLKFKADLSDKSKVERLSNLREYEQAVRKNPPPKMELYDQIAFEKENLGYAYSKWENVDSTYALVISVNKQFTPKVTLYQIKTGDEIVVKVAKKKFWENEDGNDLLYVGDIIKVLDVTEKDAWKKVDNKWVEDPTRQELHLNKCQIVRKSKKRKELA
jgi:hypothetical protein